MEKYVQPYTVQSHFIDGSCRLTLTGIVSKAQDLVSFHFGEHSLSIPHMKKRGQTWVVSKQHFEISEYPLWRDELVLESWLEPLKGPFVYYDFDFSFVEPHGRKKTATQRIESVPITENTPRTSFMKASSLWLVLDMNTLRPAKPEGTEFETFGTCDQKTCGSKFPKIELPSEWQCEYTIKPPLTDIDLNGHVNNIVYVRYILGQLPSAVRNGWLVCTLDTHYISSAHESDTLTCRSALVEETPEETANERSLDKLTVVHSIIRSDGSEVFRAKTQWKKGETLSRELTVE